MVNECSNKIPSTSNKHDYPYSLLLVADVKS